MGHSFHPISSGSEITPNSHLHLPLETPGAGSGPGSLSASCPEEPLQGTRLGGSSKRVGGLQGLQPKRGRSGNCKLMQNEKGDPRRASGAAEELDGHGEEVRAEF